MKTFYELFNFLQSYQNDYIINWLEKSWVGKDDTKKIYKCIYKIYEE